MALKLSNNASGILAAAISNSATSLTLRSGHGSRFPALSAGYYFPITVVRASDPTQLEIMRCIARSGDTLTVVRAQEGTSALAFDPGDVVELRLTAGTLEESFPQRSDLGTAATRNVTTSPTDTTSGRLLKVGDFGVGAPALLPEGTDLNTFTTNGSYDVQNAVNRPAGTADWGYLRVIRHAVPNGFCYQEWTEFGAGRTYYRVQNAGNWSPWREFYHTGNIANIISDSWLHANLAKPGMVAMFARNTPPDGWLKCNGAAVSRTTYAALFAAIGTTFGAGNGSTTFNLPDLRGEFIRGWDDGRAVDKGRAFGSWQADEFKSHNHGGGNHTHGLLMRAYDGDGGDAHGRTASSSLGTRNISSSGDIITPQGGAETRPRNVALLACIKY